MSSLSAILNTAGNAISTYQSAISVTGQNIANADNDDYSIQTVEYAATATVTTGGVTYGTGITVSSVTREVNQILENLLTTELSTEAALEEESVYMTLIEDLFTEDTDDSLNTLLDNYWTAWEDLSNNPDGTTEQAAVYEAGVSLAECFSTLSRELDGMAGDLNEEIATAVVEVNAIADEIAALNLAIIQAESTGGNANDLSDQRNALVDDLGELIDIEITAKEDGSYLITTTGGLPLVEDGISYSLSVSGDDIYWVGNSGNRTEITDDIEGGSIAGWLEVRDAIIPETLAELDELAANMIWMLNYQHSQGAGQTYYSGPMEGTYDTDDTGAFSSLAYGDEIDYTKDFTMVISDGSGTEDTYQTVTIDMGISQAQISSISGTGEEDATYVITVIDEGVLGDQTVVQSSADLMGSVSSGSSVADALDSALGEQTLTVTGGEDTTRLLISDSGSGAFRSAADIARELSDIDGITAYASTTQAQIDIDSTLASEAQDGDTVEFTLYVDGVTTTVSFTVDSSQGTLSAQLETALEAAVEDINETNQNTDLMVDGTTIESASGATIGIQEFEVVDNGGISLGGFSNFDEGDTVTLTLSTDASSPDEITVSVDLTGVDTTDSDAVAQAFYDALEREAADTPFTVELDESTGELILRTTDGSGISLSAASGDTGNDAAVTVTALAGSTLDPSGDGTLTFDNSDTEGVTPDTSNADAVSFSLTGCRDSSSAGAATIVGESGGSYDTAAVVTGSVTILMDPGMEIFSDDATSAGIFGASGAAGEGSSIITLGGTGGYEGFDDGDAISFELDGYAVSYTVASVGGVLTDAEQAEQLYTALTATLPADEYEVVMNGTSVSVVRIEDADNPISITGFTDTTSADASLAVSTGTGSGTDEPENDTLASGDALHDSTSAVTWSDSAIIYYEVFDSDGNATGESGYIEIDEPGLVEITENGNTTLSFEISEGSLVAGNTLTINTDSDGKADPLDVTVKGTANSIDDTYTFTVVSGGTLPDNDEDMVIEWTSGASSGTLTLEGNDSDLAAIAVEVDGMTLYFNCGTLVDGDTFTITTDDDGQVVSSLSSESSETVETLSDWHWTLDSFADEFNRSAGGLTATVTDDNTLVIDSSSDYCAVENLTYSNSDGITEDNVTITVTDYSTLTFEAESLQFVRTGGVWEIENDPTGGTISIIPEGGDDDGFSVDLDGDGIGDIEVTFDRTVTGDGLIQLDLVERDDTDFSYAFAGDEEDGDSGVAAALGLNTFFTGSDAATMGVNELLEDGDYLASGMVDTDTGELSSGDNTNALAMSDTRNTTIEMKEWTYTRGGTAAATVTTTTLDTYEDTMIASIGLTSASIQSSLEYSELLVYELTEQRNSVSAVSLDEEMINLTAQQQAYTAAAQLLTTVEEMFDALMATR